MARRLLESTLPPGTDDYVLAVGTAEPRKDLPSLVRAFDQLAGDRPGLALVLCGPPGWGESALHESVTGAVHMKRIVRTGWVDDTTLAGLISRASVLAYPSIYEGFGFPPLQAMAAGVPVVATRAGALFEVLGDAALMVDVGDRDALVHALDLVLGNRDVRERLVAAAPHAPRGSPGRNVPMAWQNSIEPSPTRGPDKRTRGWPRVATTVVAVCKAPGVVTPCTREQIAPC